MIEMTVLDKIELLKKDLRKLEAMIVARDSERAFLLAVAEAAEKIHDDHAARIKRAFEANTGFGFECECAVCAAVRALKETTL